MPQPGISVVDMGQRADNLSRIYPTRTVVHCLTDTRPRIINNLSAPERPRPPGRDSLLSGDPGKGATGPPERVALFLVCTVAYLCLTGGALNFQDTGKRAISARFFTPLALNTPLSGKAELRLLT